jgi:DNA-directed RNA polymerase beta' subunit
MSKCQISESVTYTALGTPEKNGLYDKRMGVYMDSDKLCDTCGLDHVKCPGHVGHIELSQTIFNPLFIKMCERLINLKCFNCHHFRMTKISKINLLIKLHSKVSIDPMDIAYRQKYWKKFSNKKLSRSVLNENYWRKDYCTISEKRMIRKDLFDLLFKQNYFLICPHCHFNNSIFEIKNNIELIQKNYKSGLKMQNVKNNSYLNNIFDIKPIIDIKETIYPIEIKKHLKALWVTEKELLNAIFQNTEVDYSVFFKEVLSYL